MTTTNATDAHPARSRTSTRSQAAAAAARLDRYQPQALTGPRWQLAAPTVTSTVLAADPATEQVAVRLAGQLCDFLASGVWDATSAPDLAALLTLPAADRFAATRVNVRSRKATRTDLRRLARIVSADTDRTPPRVVVPPLAVASQFWPLVANHGPVNALVAAYAQRGGRIHALTFHGLHGRLWTGPDLRCLLPDAPTDPGRRSDAVASVGGCGDGTVLAARTAASVLAAVTSHLPREGSTMNSSSPPAPRPAHPTRSSAVTPRRRVPAAAAKRAAAQAIAAQSAAAPSDARCKSDAPVLPQDVTDAIAAYRPKKVTAEQWEQVRDVTRALLTAFVPTSSKVTNPAGHLTRFALWVASRPGRPDPGAPVQPADVLVDGLLEAYLAHTEQAGVVASTRASQRTVIRRALQGMTGTPRPTRIAYTPIQPPYTARECADLVRLARNQPTRAKRRQLSAVVALGLGAGLDGRDQRHVTPQHIHDVTIDGTSILLVEVTGERPRTVAVRTEYADLLREAVASHTAEHRGRNTPLYGRKPDRRSVVTPVRDSTVTADRRLVDISAARLRTTWMVAAMSSPVPLNVLLPAAGIKTARTLADLLPHCPTPDPDTVAGILAALSSPPDTSGAGEGSRS